MEENIEKLTDSYYAYITYLFFDNDEEIQAIGSQFYDDYQPFRSLYLDPSINKSQIIKEYINAVLELQNIGINFYDIHAENIIVNNESHIRLVDLDETRLAELWNKGEGKELKFIDLMLQSIVFLNVKDSIWSWVSSSLILLELENKRILSSSFRDCIEGKNNFDFFISNVDCYLQELEDKEKVAIIQKELKNKYPKWFIR